VYWRGDWYLLPERASGLHLLTLAGWTDGLGQGSLPAASRAAVRPSQAPARVAWGQTRHERAVADWTARQPLCLCGCGLVVLRPKGKSDHVSAWRPAHSQRKRMSVQRDVSKAIRAAQDAERQRRVS
jgi:hypothetical protein